MTKETDLLISRLASTKKEIPPREQLKKDLIDAGWDPELVGAEVYKHFNVTTISECNLFSVIQYRGEVVTIVQDNREALLLTVGGTFLAIAGALLVYFGDKAAMIVGGISSIVGGCLLFVVLCMVCTDFCKNNEIDRGDRHRKAVAKIDERLRELQ